ncbi:MAG: 2Fe-2S iron-sulfur cluster-binding protein [Flavobacteriaceae bacterium]
MAKRHDLTVKKITRLTPSSAAITLKVPEDLISSFSFQAGQYLSLEASIGGQTVRRSYSLCSSPHEKDLTVGVKKLKNGVFSSYANDRLNVGDQLNVGLPEGRFVFIPSDEEQHLLAFAAGSGITPIFSILKTALEQTSNTSIQLVYGNKSVEESMFKAELEALEAAYPNRFKIHWVFSEDNVSEALFGRIDSSTVHYALNNAQKSPSSIYLCGPEAMIHLVKDTLIAKQLSPSKIHFELFSSASSEAPKEASIDQVELTILSDDATHVITSSAKKTLLDAALQQNIEVPYSCQGGVCSSCIAKISEGKAEMENNQILTEEEIEEGLVLTCQAYPKTTSVSVNYDDV